MVQGTSTLLRNDAGACLGPYNNIFKREATVHIAEQDHVLLLDVMFTPSAYSRGVTGGPALKQGPGIQGSQ